MAFPVIQITYESCGICREILAWGRDKGLGVVESIEWWARYSNDTIRSIGRKRNFLPQRDSYGTWSLETVFHDHMCPIECKSYLTMISACHYEACDRSVTWCLLQNMSLHELNEREEWRQGTSCFLFDAAIRREGFTVQIHPLIARNSNKKATKRKSIYLWKGKESLSIL